MCFDPSNYLPNFLKSIKTPIPKVGVHLGIVWVHSFTLSGTSKNVNVTPRLQSWFAPFHAFALVTNSRLRSWYHCSKTYHYRKSWLFWQGILVKKNPHLVCLPPRLTWQKSHFGQVDLDVTNLTRSFWFVFFIGFVLLNHHDNNIIWAMAKKNYLNYYILN